MSQGYTAKEVESKWYSYWLKHDLFTSKVDDREPFTIVIPPPNVTGVLHMGHMLNNTIQDVFIRHARMQGKNACWVPGTDHASIATEAKVVGRLREQGIKKSDLTRDHDMILHYGQGSSCSATDESVCDGSNELSDGQLRHLFAQHHSGATFTTPKRLMIKSNTGQKAAVAMVLPRVKRQVCQIEPFVSNQSLWTADTAQYSCYPPF